MENTHWKSQAQVHCFLEELYILFGNSSGDTEGSKNCCVVIQWQEDQNRLDRGGAEPLVTTPDPKNSRDSRGVPRLLWEGDSVDVVRNCIFRVTVTHNNNNRLSSNSLTVLNLI